MTFNLNNNDISGVLDELKKEEQEEQKHKKNQKENKEAKKKKNSLKKIFLLITLILPLLLFISSFRIKCTTSDNLNNSCALSASEKVSCIKLFTQKILDKLLYKKTILGYPRKYHRENSWKSLGESFNTNDYYFAYRGSVYYHGEFVTWCGREKYEYKLKNSDPKTFTIIDANYAKDKNNVYNRKLIIEKADPATFQPLDWPYAKDKNYVYYELHKILKGADPSTFEVLKPYNTKRRYTRDKNYVWYNDILIKDADPNTFEIIDVIQGCAKDKNYYFR